MKYSEKGSSVADGLHQVACQNYGKVYVRIEKYLDYPNDHTILGLSVDEDLQKMTRRQLCDFIVKETGGQGSFWALDSTSKIRFGAQLLKMNKEQMKMKEVK